MNTERKALVYLFIITIIWGLGFPITQIAINNGFQSFSIIFFRFLIGALFLTIIFRSKLKFFNFKIVIYGSITGIFLMLGFYFQTQGLVYTSSANNAFLTQMCVIFTPILTFVFFKQKTSKYSIIAACISLLGIYFLTMASSSENGALFGDFLTLVCALFVSLHVIFTSYLIKKYRFDPIMFTMMQFYITIIISAIISFTTETLPVIENNFITTYWPLLFIAIFNTALGFSVQAYALGVSEPQKTSIIVSLESLFATLFAAIFLGESITLAVLFGGILLFISVIISETQLNFLYRNRD